MSKHILKPLTPSDRPTILVFHTKGYSNIPTETPKRGRASNAGGWDMKK